MILDVYQKDECIQICVDAKKNKKLDEMLQLVIYRPEIEYFEQLLKMLYRMKKSNSFNQVKEELKANYRISLVKESPNYFWDEFSSSRYLVCWKKNEHNRIDFPKGSILYHLTKPNNVGSIIENGLIPTLMAKDNGSYYGKPRVYFSSVPIEDENLLNFDPHLCNRVQLEVEYNGEYPLYRDYEYDGTIPEHSMMYAYCDYPILIKKLAMCSRNGKRECIHENRSISRKILFFKQFLFSSGVLSKPAF